MVLPERSVTFKIPVPATLAGVITDLLPSTKAFAAALAFFVTLPLTSIVTSLS